MTRRLPFALLAGGALAFAACTGAAPTSPSPEPPATTPVPTTPAATTPEPATPSPPPTTEPSATGTPGARPTMPAQDPELAAMLPDMVGSISLIKISLLGEQFMPTAGEEFGQFVESLNVDPADVSVATATGATPDGSQNVAAVALRMPGASADQLVAAYSQAVQATGGQVAITPTQLGGKNVFSLAGGEMTQPAYFYAIDDVFFIVTASDEVLAGEAFSQLP